MRRVGSALIVCVVVVGSACSSTSATPTTIALEVETLDELDAVFLDSETVSAIIAGDEPGPEYTSNPPTSGARSEQWARCGIYRQEIPDMFQVASLARGAVIVQYQTLMTADERDTVEQIVRGLGNGVIAAPNVDLPAPIVLTGWGTMLQLSRADSDQIKAFADQYSGRGPSNADCVAFVDEAT